MKKHAKLIVSLIVLILSLILLFYSYYQYQLSPISENDVSKIIKIPEKASGKQVASILEENKLIRKEIFFTLYLKLNKVNNLKFGIYELNETMSVQEIVDILAKGTNHFEGEINLLFREGINIRDIAKVIARNTTNSEEDVFNQLKDQKFLDKLINEYWFLTEDIKNKDIYYPLEGYLAPDTYRFDNVDVSVEVIFKRMLKQMEEVLNKFKKEIEASSFSIHEFLTFSSIVESEGVNDEDRPKIAGVFYNRLKEAMPFQSCVTACYATKEDKCLPMKVDKHFESPYNTYLTSLKGKLPVGPVSIPGKASIEATAKPEKHDYLYFLADKYNKTYFSKTNNEHQAKKEDLIAKKMWIEG
ncbi:MAG: endolytic transglycosylase MltG [Bacilli bacterium]|jgi:UPF0755 protein